jgi:hypothetical protein
MSLHKLFKELKQLSSDDRYLLNQAIREMDNVKRMCKDMGVKYSDKKLISYLRNNYTSTQGIQPVAPAPFPAKKIEKIVLGDNLDIIEEAARKKGLI